MTALTDAIHFGTDGWRATLDSFTDDRVRVVAQAVADHLAELDKDAPVVVGYDARPSSPGFAESVAEVLAGNGFDVLLPERDCPTPTAVWTVVDRGCAGAVVLSASHNPPEYNGIKFFPDDGAPAMPEVTDSIESHLREPDLLPESERGEIRREDLVSPHLEAVREVVAEYGDVDLSGLTVAYDAMHGSGRGVTDALLSGLGADVVRLRCEDDPEFGGTPPEPSAEHLRELADRVESGDADIGIANDGDADRIGVATPERGHLDENLFFAATYDRLLEDHAGPAVRTVSTTFLVDRVADDHGEDVVETAVGFKWVADAMGEHDALMGGEESGGFSVRPHVREKDGVLMALFACAIEAEKPYDARVSDLEARHGPIVADKVSLDCPDDEKARVLSDLEDHIPDDVAGVPVEKTVTLDGFKLLCEDGSWLLVRPSGTEPKLRVYAEASDEARVAAILESGRDLVSPLI